MLDMGFRPAVDRIVAPARRQRQTLFFSATLDGEAGRVAPQLHARRRRARARAGRAPRASPMSSTGSSRSQSSTDSRCSSPSFAGDRELTLVFVRTKRGADRLVKRLAGHGVNAVAMHGNKSQRQREQALARFESGAVDTLVATDVAARGIDVQGISHVINFDPPADSDTYVHRIGRTGRAGANGIGITLVAPGRAPRCRASSPGSSGSTTASAVGRLRPMPTLLLERRHLARGRRPGPGPTADRAPTRDGAPRRRRAPARTS